MQLNSMQWIGLLVNTQVIPMCCMRLAENATLAAAKLLALFFHCTVGALVRVGATCSRVLAM